jgi:hypothetical protein
VDAVASDFPIAAARDGRRRRLRSGQPVVRDHAALVIFGQRLRWGEFIFSSIGRSSIVRHISVGECREAIAVDEIIKDYRMINMVRDLLNSV